MVKKKRSITEPRSLTVRAQRWRFPVAILVRMFLIGAVAVVACVWAIWRHYTVPRPPLLVPVPSAAPAVSASGEIEIEAP